MRPPRLSTAQLRALRDAMTSPAPGLVSHSVNDALFTSPEHPDRFYQTPTIRSLVERGLLAIDFDETKTRATCTLAGVWAVTGFPGLRPLSGVRVATRLDARRCAP